MTPSPDIRHPAEQTNAVEWIVLADDWGRHPSSAQHLVRHALSQGSAQRVLWINTVGTRTPKLSPGDVKRATGKLAGWLGSARRSSPESSDLSGLDRLKVVAPVMYPGFRAGWQRRFNRRRIVQAVTRAWPGKANGSRRVAVTTLPITADLVGAVPEVDRWVYYAVDNFAVWPGSDHTVMQAMERELIAKVDGVVCVSEVLRERVKSMLADTSSERHACQADQTSPPEMALLTHGVDVDFWDRSSGIAPNQADRQGPPTLTFWGLVDDRMDWDWLHTLQAGMSAKIQLVGPSAELRSTSAKALGPNESGQRIQCPGPVDHAELPTIAAESDVLIMPYRDMPVTRAMQPLKLLEYLATMKPVVVRDLPATRGWADCCDVVGSPETLVQVCRERAEHGLPQQQLQARQTRLPRESWAGKAERFAHFVIGAD